MPSRSRTAHGRVVLSSTRAATREQVLELCNRVNDSLVMIRACYPKIATTPVVYLDYHIDTETGISPEEIIFETRQFQKVAMGIVPLDTDGILA